MTEQHKPGKLWALRISNFGLIKQATVPFSKAGAHFVRGVNKDVPSASSNMSGKTTLINALTWLLYGVDSTGEDMAGRAVGPHAKSVAVSGKFTAHSRRDGKFTTFLLTRSRSASTGCKMSIHFEKSPASSEVLQPEIDNYFGTAQSFLAAHVFNDASLSFDLLPDGKKRSLMSLFIGAEDLAERAQQLEEEHNALRDLVRELEVDKASVRSSVSELKRVLADAQRIASAEEENNQREIKELRAQIVKIKATRDKHTAALKVLSEEEIALRLAQTPPSVAHSEELALSKAVHEAAGQAHFASALVELARKAEHDAGTCPLCASALKKGTLDQRVSILRKEKEQKSSEYRKLEAALSAEGKRASDLQREERERVDRVVNAKRDALSRVSVASSNLEAVLKQLAKLKESAAPSRDQVRVLQRRLLVQGKKLTALDAAEHDLRDSLGTISLLLNAFNPKGPQSIAVYRTQRLFTALNGLAAHYSDSFFGDGTRCKYDTQTNGSTRTLDRISFRCYHADGSEAVQPSAGQRKRMDVIHALVMSAAAGAAGMKTLDVAIFDEVFTNLDASGIEAVADVLTALRQSTRSVFVVEHDDDLAAEFSSQYVVTREGGASRVEVSK